MLKKTISRSDLFFFLLQQKPKLIEIQKWSSQTKVQFDRRRILKHYLTTKIISSCYVISMLTLHWSLFYCLDDNVTRIYQKTSLVRYLQFVQYDPQRSKTELPRNIEILKY